MRALAAENFNPKTFGDLVGKCGIIYEVDYDSSIRQVTFNGTGKQISFIGNTKNRRIFIPWWSIDLWKDRLLSDYAFHYYVIDAVDSALKKINDAEIDFKKASNARRVRVNEFVAKKMIGKELNDE